MNFYFATVLLYIVTIVNFIVRKILAYSEKYSIYTTWRYHSNFYKVNNGIGIIIICVVISIITYILLNLFLNKKNKNIKHYNIEFQNLNKKNLNNKKILNNKKKVIFNTICLLLILIQIIRVNIYLEKIPDTILIFNLIFIGIYLGIANSNIKIMKKHIVTNERIENLKDYNNNLKQAYDDVRAFKHDFNNIMQAFGGYIDYNDFQGLKKYYTDLVCENNIVKGLATINPISINEQNLYNTILKKVNQAKNKGIGIELISSIDFQTLPINSLELSYLIENLLERAIYFSESTEKKEIIITCLYDNLKQKNVIVIINYYENEKENELKQESKMEDIGLPREINDKIKKNPHIKTCLNYSNNILVQEIKMDVKNRKEVRKEN